ncbi:MULTISPECIES: hypothetical protein [Lactobacillaceae]|uniref:hypothetical protein n=1 Tax=Lactobacillaceae TaxID=33958 RepID=UPI001456317F|nr:hypothetical protein [Lactobacillus sp. HBUAS51381]NLR09827.1 hypothetical protein [Lactobacillus sp. HBUAS51381]
MEKMHLFQGALAIGVGVGLLGFGGISAAASSQYSAARSRSVRLVWRKPMKQRAYTATTGSRFSRHLGVRYSKNKATANVTWYTDAHEKMYKKYQGHSTIYYHVKSADRTLQGWIWRGYLKPVKAKTSDAAVTATANPDDPGTRAPIANERLLDQEILNLFPGTIEDKTLDQQAGAVVYTDDGEEGPTVKPGQVYIRLYNSARVMNTQNYANLLAKAGYPATKRSQYRGWHIGVRAQVEDGYGEGVSQGDAAIFLAPGK